MVIDEPPCKFNLVDIHRVMRWVVATKKKDGSALAFSSMNSLRAGLKHLFREYHINVPEALQEELGAHYRGLMRKSSLDIHNGIGKVITGREPMRFRPNTFDTTMRLVVSKRIQKSLRCCLLSVLRRKPLPFPRCLTPFLHPPIFPPVFCLSPALSTFPPVSSPHCCRTSSHNVSVLAHRCHQSTMPRFYIKNHLFLQRVHIRRPASVLPASRCLSILFDCSITYTPCRRYSSFTYPTLFMCGNHIGVQSLLNKCCTPN